MGETKAARKEDVGSFSAKPLENEPRATEKKLKDSEGKIVDIPEAKSVPEQKLDSGAEALQEVAVNLKKGVSVNPISLSEINEKPSATGPIIAIVLLFIIIQLFIWLLPPDQSKQFSDWVTIPFNK